MKVYILASGRRDEVLRQTVDTWASQGFYPEVIYNENRMPGVGRNLILGLAATELQVEKNKWFAIADEDTVLVPRLHDTAKFLADPARALSKLPSPIQIVAPFFHDYYNRFPDNGWWGVNPQYERNWVLFRDVQLTGKCLFYSVGRDPIIKFDENMVLEDWDWALQHVKAKRHTAMMPNIVLHESCYTNTSLDILGRDAHYTEQQKKRGKAYAKALKILRSRFKEIRGSSLDTIDFTDFIDKYWVTENPTWKNWREIPNQGVQIWTPFED